MRLSFQRSLLAISLCTLTVLTGCSKKKDAEDPVVLGIPAQTAYLGVEYEYNFGAYGGDNLLNFSLTNAPAWMALEEKSNDARYGIILRGVPGITGGRRGEEDLGETDQIEIVSNDGERVGSNVFSVTVKNNPLTIEDVEVIEGEPYLPAANDQPKPEEEREPGEEDTSTECLLPQVYEALPDNAGDNAEPQPIAGSFVAKDVPIIDSSGSTFEKVDREFKTYPVVIPVKLEQPSVEPITVAWKLTDRFSGVNNCIVGNLNDKDAECQYSDYYRDNAILLQDFVATSDNENSAFELPDYLKYDGANSTTSGLLQIPAGKTTCYIRIEVVDDNFPEKDEAFDVQLTEVRQGLATIDDSGAKAISSVTIKDDEPSVTFDTDERVVTEGDTISVTATLNKVAHFDNDENEIPRTEPVKVVIENDDVELGTARDEDFVFIDADGNEFTGSITLTFPPDEDSQTFKVKAIANTTDGLGVGDTEDVPESQDDLIALVVDENEQFGRDNYARAAEDESLSIYINEWTASPDLGDIADDFIPTSLATGLFSEVYVAGVTGNTTSGDIAAREPAAGDEIILRRINRLGALDAENLLDDEPNAGSGRVWGPRVDASSTVTENQEGEITRQLGVAVAATTNGVLSNEARGIGGKDIAISALFDEEAGDVDSYQVKWQRLIGSPEDDELAWIGVPNLDSMYVGAETTGAWADSEESPKGGLDVAIVELDGIEHSGNVDQVNISGTELDDVTVGGGIGPISYGYTEGTLVSEDQVGMADFFSLGVQRGASSFDSAQAGTEENDIPSAAGVAAKRAIVVGSAPFTYSYDSEDKELLAANFSSRLQGYLLEFETFNGVKSVLSLPNGTGDEHLYAVKVDGDFIVAGGSANGVFQDGAVDDGVDDAILVAVRATRDSDGDKLEELWRVQLEGTEASRVIDLDIYEQRKIFALIENTDSGGGRSYEIALFDFEGNRLDH
ncbi:hypothetical protein QQM79_01315 [Marinobacteraceae bacterium S3BR75-40.1]